MLAPLQPPLHGDNDNSEVIRLDYGNTSWLFTGDIQTDAEERLLQNGSNLGATVLKVAHHGSSDSTSNWTVGKRSQLREEVFLGDIVERGRK